jgi:hypothetical protein
MTIGTRFETGWSGARPIPHWMAEGEPNTLELIAADTST